MKNLERIKINSEKLLKNEELIALKGGDAPVDCPYRACKTDTDCCPGNPTCMEPIGWPGPKYCFSPA